MYIVIQQIYTDNENTLQNTFSELFNLLSNFEEIIVTCSGYTLPIPKIFVFAKNKTKKTYNYDKKYWSAIHGAFIADFWSTKLFSAFDSDFCSPGQMSSTSRMVLSSTNGLASTFTNASPETC